MATIDVRRKTILRLAERKDLDPEDGALCEKALEIMAATGKSSPAYKIIMPLIHKYGRKKALRLRVPNILKLAAAGVSDEEIAVAEGIGVKRVHELQVIYGKGRKEVPSTAMEQRLERVRSLVAAGYLLQQIASAEHITEEALMSWAERHGITFPANKLVGGGRVDLNRLVEQTVLNAQGVTAGIDMLEGNSHVLDKDRIPNWVDSLRDSVNQLNRLIYLLKKEEEVPNGNRKKA